MKKRKNKRNEKTEKNEKKRKNCFFFNNQIKVLK